MPGATPLTTPPGVMVAIPVLPLLHVPPVAASVNVMVDPTHTDVGPEITELVVSHMVTGVAIFQ